MRFSRFELFWLAELQRQRDVSDADQQADRFRLTELDAKQGMTEQLLERARRSAERRKDTQHIGRWQQLRRLLTLIFALLAVALGIGATQAVLNQPQPISLLFAVSVLVVPNLIMLLLWALVAVRRNRPVGVTASGLQLLEWLQRSSQAHELGTAWLSHVQQQKLLQPLMAMLSNGFWLLIALSSWATLLLYLSFNDYAFHWATTILSEEQLHTFVRLAHYLPELLFGATLPELSAASAAANFDNTAGRWLSLTVVSYAVLPRAVIFSAAFLLFSLRCARMQLDLNAPGHVATVRAIEAAQRPTRNVDADSGREHESLTFRYASEGKGEVSLSLDFEADPNWRGDENYLGVVARQQDKKALLDRLDKEPAERLEVRIAGSLTPDRSSLRYLAALAARTRRLTVVLVKSAGTTYLKQWQELLEQHEVTYVDTE
ncbi:DUF2868 domain-containing protein [Pseudidiomarina insulisalsae]|uniref:DUF2868 domain-containing protein n=1 Tax=Pseudidiomarina insulisalsae TaxID=575789 RepID=A0A432YH48_9GAMM|nr:DUF2868 domain-containing protein [Pseudidiomarina insulisalsae]RUO60250.1 hypothetical protein CWI71_07510 [Pseudidiomarina insulisalsae]